MKREKTSPPNEIIPERRKAFARHKTNRSSRGLRFAQLLDEANDGKQEAIAGLFAEFNFTIGEEEP